MYIYMCVYLCVYAYINMDSTSVLPRPFAESTEIMHNLGAPAEEYGGPDGLATSRMQSDRCGVGPPTVQTT